MLYQDLKRILNLVVSIGVICEVKIVIFILKKDFKKLVVTKVGDQEHVDEEVLAFKVTKQVVSYLVFRKIKDSNPYQLFGRISV